MEESFGKRLKRIRKKRGVTQEQAARHLGIQASTYANWEQERGTPSLAMLPPLPKHQKMVREMIRVMAEAERTS